MEPISYLMMFGNFTFGFAFYMAMKRDLDLTSIHDVLTHRFLVSAAKKQGIDWQKHKDVKQEIEELTETLSLLKK